MVNCGVLYIYNYVHVHAGYLKKESQLLMYTDLVHLICISISFQPKIVATFQNYEHLVKKLLDIFANSASSLPLDVS